MLNNEQLELELCAVSPGSVMFFYDLSGSEYGGQEWYSTKLSRARPLKYMSKEVD